MFNILYNFSVRLFITNGFMDGDAAVGMSAIKFVAIRGRITSSGSATIGIGVWIFKRRIFFPLYVCTKLYKVCT